MNAPDALPWDRFDEHQALTAAENQTPVYIIGAGLAGCWMARTLAEAGLPVVVLEAGSQPAGAASANPAGIVKPFVTRGASQSMQFYLEAYEYLLNRLRYWKLSEHCQHTACGVVQLVDKPYPDCVHYSNVLPEQMQDTLGVPCDSHGLLFDGAGWLNPAALCRSLLQHPLIRLQLHCRVRTIHRSGNLCWTLHAGKQVFEAVSRLVLTTGSSLKEFSQSRELCITPARGQISRFALMPGAARLKRVVNGRHYIIPDGDTVLAGASFERNVSVDAIRQADNAINRAGLGQTLSSLAVGNDALEAFAGVRATTPDRLPLIGPLPDMQRVNELYSDIHLGRRLADYPTLPLLPGMYVLGGLGSRGIVTAPIAATLLTDLITGGQRIAAWSAIINPARFHIRALKRQQRQPEHSGQESD